MRALVVSVLIAAGCGSFGSTNDPRPATVTDGGVDAGVDADAPTNVGRDGSPGEDVDTAKPSYEVVHAGAVEISAVATTAQKLYFTDRAPGTFFITDHDGTNVQTAPVGGAPSGVVVAGSYVFVSNNGGAGAVWKLRLDGVAVDQIETGVGVRTIAGSADELALVTGTGVTTMKTDKTDIHVLGGLVNGYDAAFFGTAAWITDSAAAKVYQYEGSTQVLKAQGEVDVRTIACASDGTVAWTRPTANVVRVLRGGTGLAATLSDTEPGAYSIAAEGTSFYWLTDDGRVRRNVTGNAIETFASGFEPSPERDYSSAIAFTQTHVYWIAQGRLLRKAK